MKHLFIAILCLLTLSAVSQIKVACVGNSVTFGMAMENRATLCYPAVLARKLGAEYIVENFGKSGATLLAKGHNPYIKTAEYQQALQMKADIVIIHLGINDTDPRNYPIYQEQFASDYLALIDSFRKVNPKIRVIIARLSPIFHTHRRFNAGTRVWYAKIQAEIEKIAEIANCELIDFQEVLYNRPELLPDSVHPNAEGASLLANRAYEAITGDFGGLQLSPLYSDDMVLQRSSATKIEGVANANQTIEVKIGSISEVCKSNSNGKWIVKLPLTNYTAGQTLTIKSDEKTVSFKNVAIGEVWLLSGQSNMSWSVESSNNPEKAIPSDNIRLFKCNPAFDSQDSLSAEVLQQLNNLDYIRQRSWAKADLENVKNFSAVGYYFAQRLQQAMPNVTIGLIQTSLGGAAAEGFVERSIMESDPLLVNMLTNWSKNPMVMQWCRDVGTRCLKGAKVPLQRHFFEPVFLYESRIKPLSNFTIQGVLWYQGESNAENTELHETIFPAVVRSFRNAFSNDSLPFYFVQLSSLNRLSWCRFRESQRLLAESIENCEMVVSSDHGDPNDVHPRTKNVIGERLANVALARDYGFSDLEYRSAKALSLDGNKITFEHIAGALSTSDNAAVRGFEVSNDDLIYTPVEAEITGNKITLNISTTPKYIRYGWQPFTDANVVNGVNLPLSTFKICQTKKSL